MNIHSSFIKSCQKCPVSDSHLTVTAQLMMERAKILSEAGEGFSAIRALTPFIRTFPLTYSSTKGPPPNRIIQDQQKQPKSLKPSACE